MKFTELDIKGVYIIELEKAEDNRGFFARAWDLEIFEKKGLTSKFVQSNISFNKKKVPQEEYIIKQNPIKKTNLYDVLMEKHFK